MKQKLNLKTFYYCQSRYLTQLFGGAHHEGKMYLRTFMVILAHLHEVS
jgi:hypothetical protein